MFGTADDIGTYRAMRDAGAVDYFPLPVEARAIMAALTSTTPRATPAPQHATRTLAVLGAKGGVGASTLTHNLAALAAQDARDTLIVDGDLRLGSASSELNRAAAPGLMAALAAPDRVDDTFLKATMDQIDPHLFLYSEQMTHPDEAPLIEQGLVQRMPRLARHMDVTLIDLQRDYLMRHDTLLEVLDHLILMVPGGSGGVHIAARLLDMIDHAAPDLPVTLIYSELRKDAGVPAKELATALKRPVDHTLPRCDPAMMRAEKAGKILAQSHPRAPYVKATRKVWRDITSPAEARAPRSRLVRRLFS